MGVVKMAGFGDIKAYIVLKVIDPKGKVVKTKKVPCHTFLKNFSEIVWIDLFIRGDISNTATVTNTGGVAQAIQHSNCFYYNPSSSYKLKCTIGTGTQAFDRTQFNVQTLLATLDYTQYDIVDDSTQKTLTISFSYLNSSGSAKDVTEACIVAVYVNTGASAFAMAPSRDVFVAVNVPNNYTLAIGYVITFPW